MEAWEVLERAADLIERDGWEQGDGTACLIGGSGDCAQTAVNRIACDGASSLCEMEETARPALAALRAALGGDDNEVIWHWNDAPGRTAEEVIAMLRAVAASLKAARTEGTRQHVGDSTVVDVAAGSAAVLEHV